MLAIARDSFDTVHLMQVTTLKPGDARQQDAAARQAADVLRAGGLVVFPTETVYGVAASALIDDGVRRLRALKDADDKRAFTVHIPGPEAIQRYAELTGGVAGRLAAKAMPGPLTLLIEVTPEVIADRLKQIGLTEDRQSRIYHRGIVGLRCPDHPIAQRVLAELDTPVIASSANLPGERPPINADQAAQAVGDRVELVIDGGPCRYAKPSTIVHVAGKGADQALTVRREGVYDERYIDKLTLFTVLMVCSGNTCRSPMAQGIATQLIAEHLSVDPKDLKQAGVVVRSAGAYTSQGMLVTHEAVLALEPEGVDISGHRSTLLTRELVDQADVIYCMTRVHIQAVLALSPGAADKTFAVDPDTDIGDPIGAGTEVYRSTAQAIRLSLTRRLKELPL